MIKSVARQISKTLDVLWGTAEHATSSAITQLQPQRPSRATQSHSSTFKRWMLKWSLCCGISSVAWAGSSSQFNQLDTGDGVHVTNAWQSSDHVGTVYRSWDNPLRTFEYHFDIHEGGQLGNVGKTFERSPNYPKKISEMPNDVRVSWDIDYLEWNVADGDRMYIGVYGWCNDIYEPWPADGYVDEWYIWTYSNKTIESTIGYMQYMGFTEIGTVESDGIKYRCFRILRPEPMPLHDAQWHAIPERWTQHHPNLNIKPILEKFKEHGLNDLNTGISCSVESFWGQNQGKVRFTNINIPEFEIATKTVEIIEKKWTRNDQGWDHVNLNGFTDPIVIASPVTNNGGDPCHVRIDNVNVNGFDYTVEEWNYLDGPHGADETLQFLVLERGVHNIGGRTWEATSTYANSEWKFAPELNAAFSSGGSAILTQVVTNNETDAVISKIKDVNLQKFRIRLQEEEALGNHESENVHIVAIQTGRETNGSIIYKAGHKNYLESQYESIDFGVTVEKPAIFTQIRSEKESDTCGVRYRDLTGSSVSVKLEEERSFDSETTHGEENIHFLMIDASQMDSSELDPYLIAHYPLDGNSMDAVGYQDLTHTVNAPQYISGKFGQAAKFDATLQQAFYRDLSPEYGSPEALSLSFWVKQASNTWGNFVHLAKDSGSSSYMRIGTGGSNQSGDYLWFLDPNETTISHLLDADTDMNASTWKHMCITMASGQAMRYYLEGELIHTSSEAYNSGGIDFSAIIIGARFNSSRNLTSFSSSSLDDIRIYNKALSQTEVLLLKNQ